GDQGRDPLLGGCQLSRRACAAADACDLSTRSVGQEWCSEGLEERARRVERLPRNAPLSRSTLHRAQCEEGEALLERDANPLGPGDGFPQRTECSLEIVARSEHESATTMRFCVQMCEVGCRGELFEAPRERLRLADVAFAQRSLDGDRQEASAKSPRAHLADDRQRFPDLLCRVCVVPERESEKAKRVARPCDPEGLVRPRNELQRPFRILARFLEASGHGS